MREERDVLARAPLAGVRVVDLTTLVSGPLATCILADQGADVIKVEQAGGGDLLRHMGFSRGGLSAIFTTVNRGKRSLAVDLREVRGQSLVRRLAEAADVFVQNFRPGVVEALGLAEPQLRAANPDLIYVSISGFGRRGPYAAYPAYDIVIQALSGMTTLQADEKTGTPALVQTVVCDKITALHAAQAISAALLARERGGGGQHVELSLFDATVAFLWPDGMEAQTLSGEGVKESPSRMRDVAHVHRSCDGYVTLMAVSDDQFRGLCRALRLPALAEDPRFQTLEGRFGHARALAGAVREAVARFATDEICERLRKEGVPAGPVLSPEALMRDPHVLATDLLLELDHPLAGKLRMPRPVARFGGGAGSPPGPAPGLGEHSLEILGELGLPRSDIDRMQGDGLIYCGSRPCGSS